VLPTDEQVDQKVQEIFANSGIETLEVAFSLESAKSSFPKTIEKLPHSDRTQEFKDGVLWADCCRLLEDDDVCLVTSDKAFYAARDYSKELATNLTEEVSAAKHSIRLFTSLGELLKDLKTEVALDIDSLANTLIQEQRTTIESTLSRNGFQLGERMSVSRALYVTERPNILYLKFTLEFACDDITSEGPLEGRLLLEGVGSYDVEDGSFADLRNFGENLSFRLRDGADRIVRNTVILAGSMILLTFTKMS
jgi:hypothetical protein